MAMKNQYFLRMRSPSENVDIFTSRDEIHLVYYIFTKKRIFFSFYFIPQENLQKKLTFSLVILARFDIFSVFI